jgi:outer membrane immunogenic protein
MRNILLASLAFGVLAGQALAADLPSIKAAPVFEPPMAVSWTGFYTGDQVGAAWGQGQWSNGVSANSNIFGALGGEHIGYRRQYGAWVLGVQGQLDMVGAGGLTNINATTRLQLRQTWLYSGDAQVGYAVDRWMFYAIGGVAFTSTVSDYVVGGIDTTTRNNLAGFDVGAGAEYAISDHWSAFAEYRFYDFGKANYAASGIRGIEPARSLALTDNALRLGASYRFNLNDIFAPEASKY